MLYMHQRGGVIGSWENLRVEESKLLADANFDMEDPEAAKIAGKVKRGFLKAVSIGIHILAYHFEKDTEGEILVVDECELYEASIVDVPSNRSALKLFDVNRNEIDLTKGFVELKANFPVSPKPSKTIMDLKLLAKTFGLPETATEQEILDAASKAKEAEGNLATLEQKQKEAQSARAVKLFDDAVAQKRISADKKDKFMKLAEADFELFEDTIGSLPAPVSLTEVAKGKIPVATTLSDEKKAWTFEEWRQKDPSGLLSLQANDWDKFAALFEAEYGEKPAKD